MNNLKSKTAYLVLADGTVFKGYSMGVEGTVVGEVVFNTCSSSYQELLSDPTYYGQIVAQTYPLVRNRVPENSNERVMANGYIVREWFDSATAVSDDDTATLSSYLKSRNVIGICGIDTRKLTRILRDKGYFKGAITNSIDNMDDLLKKISEYSIEGAVAAVTTSDIYEIRKDESKYNLAVMDYGFPKSSLEPYINRGCNIKVYPAFTKAEDVLADNPDGILLPDGPGDPDDDIELVEEIKKFFTADKPIMAIGLGHQMLALATGGKIEKMLHGHRGSNQPVKCVDTSKLMVTTQNHGYAVSSDSVDTDVAKVSAVNINDNTVEALEYLNKKIVSLQFNPLDGKGYQDTAWYFDKFIEYMEGEITENA